MQSSICPAAPPAPSPGMEVRATQQRPAAPTARCRSHHQAGRCASGSGSGTWFQSSSGCTSSSLLPRLLSRVRGPAVRRRMMALAAAANGQPSGTPASDMLAGEPCTHSRVDWLLAEAAKQYEAVGLHAGSNAVDRV